MSIQTARFEQLSARNDKRNFRLGVTNGVVYSLGTYFISRTTVIPSFFSHLTHSGALIGLVSQFESIGWYLPQFIAASFVLHLPRKLHLYRIGWWVRGLALFGLAAVTLASPNPGLLLVLGIILYGMFALGSGLSGVVFLELVAKTIPSTRRGRFFGLRLSLGSLLSITVGAGAISLILGLGHFPTNFGFVFLIGAAIVTIGLGFMAFMREPRSRNMPDERTLAEHFREGWRVYRQDTQFSAYLNARLIMGTWTIGVPFLVLFAHDRLGFQTRDLGLFIAADCIGTVAGNFLWERLTDKVSSKACLEGAAIVGALLPLIVLVYLWVPLPPFLFASVFALAAAFDAGTSIGGMSYLIEISPEHDRATHIGLFNSMMALPCFLSAGAGALLDLTGFGLLYGLVFAISIVSFFAIRSLQPK
ncbi:MAG: MFS transporter [Bacteroidota bacterium]|nr:MFS transporter [Bacteroidota bacterium]MDP4232385.1 MFS transporter [Bacteroidota bacterium]MDP4241522.1 MFS transporter [Bacteroidota bacterium]MDP4288256.1 MFS transporter [Bacteroidota bacterium]